MWNELRSSSVDLAMGRRSVIWQNSLVFSGGLHTKLTVAQNFKSQPVPFGPALLE